MDAFLALNQLCCSYAGHLSKTTPSETQMFVDCFELLSRDDLHACMYYDNMGTVTGNGCECKECFVLRKVSVGENIYDKGNRT